MLVALPLQLVLSNPCNLSCHNSGAYTLYAVCVCGGGGGGEPLRPWPDQSFVSQLENCQLEQKLLNVSHQELTISYQRDLELKTLTTFKWSNPIAVSNHFGNWLTG